MIPNNLVGWYKMRKIWWVFLFFLVGAGGCLAEEPKVFVQYHLLFATKEPLVPNSRFGPWNGWYWNWDDLGKDLSGYISPWRKKTESRLGLPITGYYASRDLEVVRYQYNLAKEAGIDGFLESPYDGSWWNIFESHLEVAKQVGFKLGLELYAGVSSDNVNSPGLYSKNVPMKSNNCQISYEFQIGNLASNLTRFKDHPAFLRIDGRPVVWIANGLAINKNTDEVRWRSWYPSSDCEIRDVYRWGDVAELSEVMRRVKERIGVWPYLVLSSDTFDNKGRKFSDVAGVEKVAVSEVIGVFWNEFLPPGGHEANQKTIYLGKERAGEFKNMFQYYIDYEKGVSGNKVALNVHNAFDERGLFPTNEDRMSGISLPRSIITRDGNGMFEKDDGFLKMVFEAAKANNTWVFLNSWNDWLEQHQIEPGFSFNNFAYHEDYFSALRRVAEFKGISNPDFKFPSVEIMDEKLVEFCRHQQFEGKRVMLRGEFVGGGDLSVDYLDDYISYQDPSYLPANTWKNWKKTTGKTFEVDITPILDVPGIVFGVDGVGGENIGNVYWNKLELDWYGQKVDLLNKVVWDKLGWHNQNGAISWQEKIFNGSTSKFVHAGLNWMSLEGFLPRCGMIKTQATCPSGENKGSTGDVNCDGVVNLVDYGIWANEFRDYGIGNYNARDLWLSDLNGNGEIDIIDFGILVGKWGR